VLLLGIGLGLRHASDADHVVVVSALVQREPGAWRAARIAALWGMGHSAAFLGVGLLIVMGQFRATAAFETVAELLVAAMLIGLGIWHLIRRPAPADRTEPAISSARPLLIGLVHGIAGSAGIALLAATTIASPALAAAYLLLFALGTVLGMVTLTVLMSRPIGWTARRGPRWGRGLTMLSAVLSLSLGLAVIVQTLWGGGVT